MARSGLLIADLTGSNPNVYHEIGYIMGMARDKTKPYPNLLLLCNERITPLSTVGFNIRGYHILAFKDTHELKPKLEKQLEACYTEGNMQRVVHAEVSETEVANASPTAPVVVA